ACSDLREQLASPALPRARVFITSIARKSHQWQIVAPRHSPCEPSCYLLTMRGCALLFLLALPACGGGGESATAPSPKTAAAAAADDADRGFSEYAATRVVSSLDHPEEAPGVTADGLRLEALDRTKPIKLDG